MHRKIIVDLSLVISDIDFFYHPSLMLQFSEFVWTLRSSVRVVFNNFLHIDAIDRSKLVAMTIDNFSP